MKNRKEMYEVTKEKMDTPDKAINFFTPDQAITNLFISVSSILNCVVLICKKSYGLNICDVMGYSAFLTLCDFLWFAGLLLIIVGIVGIGRGVVDKEDEQGLQKMRKGKHFLYRGFTMIMNTLVLTAISNF